MDPYVLYGVTGMLSAAVGLDKEQCASNGRAGIPQPGEQRGPFSAWNQVHSHATQQAVPGDGTAFRRREGT